MWYCEVLRGSSSVTNYRPISITSVLPKVFERLVAVRIGQFMECSGVLPTTQFVYPKGLGSCDALLCLTHTLQSALESWQEDHFAASVCPHLLFLEGFEYHLQSMILLSRLFRNLYQIYVLGIGGDLTLTHGVHHFLLEIHLMLFH